MKKNDMDRVFRKLDLIVRSTGHNYGWLIFKGKKILRVHYSHGKGDISVKITSKIRGQLKLLSFPQFVIGNPLLLSLDARLIPSGMT